MAVALGCTERHLTVIPDAVQREAPAPIAFRNAGSIRCTRTTG
jgi:hypothetical protein